MKFKLRLRNFIPSDLQQILKMEKSSFNVCAYTKKRLQKLAKNYPNNFFIAENSGKILGYIIGYKTKGKYGYLDSITASSKYRNLGLGKLMLRHLFCQFKKKGLQYVSLETRAKNKKAILFFQKAGFKIKKILKKYYLNKVDAFQMQKTLNYKI